MDVNETQGSIFTGNIDEEALQLPTIKPDEDFSINNVWNMDYIAKGGADTIYMTMKIKWRNKHKDIRAHLNDIKEIQQRGGCPEADFVPEVMIDGHTWYVAPQGMNTGDSKFSYFPLQLKECGIRYLLAERDLEECTASGNLTVMIGSLPLMKWGEEICFKIVMSSVRALGGVVKDISLGRYDVCLDMPGVACREFQDAIEKGRYVCRAKRKTSYFIDHSPDTPTKISLNEMGRKKTGVTIGKSNIICRIYDKLEEVKHDEDKSIVLLQNRYDEAIPDCATRIEFQINRDGLRNFEIIGKRKSIRTWDDMQEFKGHIFAYLVNSWLRVYRRDFDRSHTSRLTDDDLLPIWREVISGFQKIADGKGRLVKSGDKPKLPEKKALKKQGLGVLLSILAGTFDHQYTRQDIVFRVAVLMEEIMREYTFKELRSRIKRKLSRYCANSVMQYEALPF